MFCAECGFENKDDSNFCVNCSTALKKESLPVSQSTNVSAIQKPIKKVTLLHFAGLPIASGLSCTLYDYLDKIDICNGYMFFTLSKSKITDVCLRTDVEIRKQYVSSVGGAVGGAVLFGPLGAMIGGRAKQKQDKTVHTYLIFTYLKDGQLQYIGFEATRERAKAMKFVNDFRVAMKNSPHQTAAFNL
ncbi:MAG: hypothetical protein VB064_13035 [Oscillospiraceae bacterium]|nr:hypothetical protein [Oscillospiraceae bacterium]